MPKNEITITIDEYLFRAVLCAMDNAVNETYPDDAWFAEAWAVLREVEKSLK